MKIFNTGSNGIYQAPEYLSYSTEWIVKGTFIAVIILLFVIVALILRSKSKKRLSKIKDEDNYDSLSEKERQVKDIDYKMIKKDKKIYTVLIFLILSIMTFFSYRTYDNFLINNRFIYSEDMVDNISKDKSKKVEEKIEDVKVLEESKNHTNELFRNDNYSVKNNYFGQYGNEYATLYKVKVTTKDNKEIELDAQLLPSSTKEDEDRLTYIKGDKDEKLNGLITLSADKIDTLGK